MTMLFQTMICGKNTDTRCDIFLYQAWQEWLKTERSMRILLLKRALAVVVLKWLPPILWML